ncbi:FxsA family protein [Aliikangiella sp. IMCC44653]
MQFVLLLFILVPIIEIGVFIQVGGLLGLPMTLLVVLATAVIGVSLLKQQGLKAWSDIQLSLAQGKIPAKELAAGAQLLFAGALLLTPGFVTDAIGFSLMLPKVRALIAHLLIQRWGAKVQMHQGGASTSHFYSQHEFNHSKTGRVIDSQAEEVSSTEKPKDSA